MKSTVLKHCGRVNPFHKKLEYVVSVFVSDFYSFLLTHIFLFIFFATICFQLRFDLPRFVLCKKNFLAMLFRLTSLNYTDFRFSIFSKIILSILLSLVVSTFFLFFSHNISKLIFQKFIFVANILFLFVFFMFYISKSYRVILPTIDLYVLVSV